MEAVFAALSKRQSMLLLTSVTFGGQSALESFEHLPPDESELLKHRATQLLAIPRDRRIPLLVQEMKRLVTVRRGRLWSAEPERLAEVLLDERPILIEVVLRALPAGLADATRDCLPRQRLGAKVDKEVRPEMLNLIRWKLEERLGQQSKRAGFKFSDVALLRTRELITLCDRLGGMALAPALAALPELERMAFLDALTPDQKAHAKTLLAGDVVKKLTEEEARAVLAPFDTGRGPSELLRNAGLQRLARALVAQSPEFSQRVLERQSGEFGTALARWLREERPRVTAKVDAGRTDIVVDLERLAKLGVVDHPTRLPPKKRTDVPRVHESDRPRVRSDMHSASGLSHGGGSLVPPRLRASIAGAAELSNSGRRDLMAERAARKAGIPVPIQPAPSLPFRSAERPHLSDAERALLDATEASEPLRPDAYRELGTHSSPSGRSDSGSRSPTAQEGRTVAERPVSERPAVLERRPRKRAPLEDVSGPDDVTDPARPIAVEASEVSDGKGDT